MTEEDNIVFLAAFCLGMEAWYILLVIYICEEAWSSTLAGNVLDDDAILETSLTLGWYLNTKKVAKLV